MLLKFFKLLFEKYYLSNELILRSVSKRNYYKGMPAYFYNIYISVSMREIMP